MRMPTVTLTALVLFAGAGATPAADDTAPRILHLDVVLADGTRILGLATDLRLTITTNLGRIDTALAAGDRIEANDDRETVTLHTARGDVVKGVIENDGILVHPYDAAEPRSVPGHEIRTLVAMDPIRIAGDRDAVWEVGYEHATGWTPTVRDGVLTVRGIAADKVHTDSGGPWSTVRLTRRVDDRDDFELEAVLSWDDLGTGMPVMRNLFVSVVDENRGVIAAVGHHDAWFGETGSRYFLVPGVNRTKDSGWNSAPLCGRGTVGIVRKDGEIRVLWDGVEGNHGRSRAKASRIEVQFDFYDYRSGATPSTFGSATLHRLELR